MICQCLSPELQIMMPSSRKTNSLYKLTLVLTLFLFSFSLWTVSPGISQNNDSSSATDGGTPSVTDGSSETTKGDTDKSKSRSKSSKSKSKASKLEKMSSDSTSSDSTSATEKNESAGAQPDNMPSAKAARNRSKKSQEGAAEPATANEGEPRKKRDENVNKASTDPVDQKAIEPKKKRDKNAKKDAVETNDEKTKEAKKKRDKKAQAEEREGISIPVLYLTDRDNDEKKNYGSRRKYIVDCKHDMFYGTANVIVRNTDAKRNSELFKNLGWTPGGKRSVDEVTCDKIASTEPDGGKGEFLKRLQTSMEQAGSDDVCLFVHGADEGFDDAARDAAALAYSMQCPLILYSWPSVPKAISYVVDGGNNEWSQGHFNTFVKDLIEFKKEHKLHLIIISHSMGNRLVIRAAVHLERTQLVKDVELVSPDIDAETFKHYIMGMENQGAVLRLYTSTKDKMLPLSQMMYGGYYRLGEGVGEVFGGLGKKKDDQDSSSKQDARIDSKSDDDIAVSSGNHLPHHKRGLVERIDFTDIDEGVRGHSIPFQALASMIHNDEPGNGLALLASKPGKGSGLARFMSWSHHLGKYSDENDNDLCKKIVHVKEKKGD